MKQQKEKTPWKSILDIIKVIMDIVLILIKILL
jgi:hypothetical protein